MSSGIQNFAETGFHDHKAIIGPVAAYGPLVVEGGILAKNAYDDPGYFWNKIKEIGASLKADFTRSQHESGVDFAKRVSKNAAVLIGCVGLMALAVWGSAFILPVSAAVPVAIGAIYASGKLYLNRAECAKFVKESFTSVEDEEKRAAQIRVIRNFLLVAIVAAGIGVALHYVVEPLITEGFSWEVEVPLQSKGVVFGEYAFLGLIHAGLACKKRKEGNNKEFAFHCVAAVLSIAFPIFYLIGGDMRLHHSFMGLALMALPFKPAKYIGSIITFDSSLYAASNPRGFYDSWGHFREFDFMNIVVNKYDQFFGAYSAALVLEDVNRTYDRDHAKAELEDAVANNL